MSIYTPIIITEEIRQKFVPTRLYIKRHTKTGLRYFGKSSREEIVEYLGSGTRWGLHLEKHGREHVVTDWISDWFTNPEDLQEFALRFSEQNAIVESDDWANLKPEYGLEGGPGATFSDQERAARSERASGENNPMYGTSRKGKQNPFFGKNHSDESKSRMGPRGQTMPDSQREATRTRMANRTKKECPHCNRWFDPQNYSKSHGDKCGKKPLIEQ